MILPSFLCVSVADLLVFHFRVLYIQRPRFKRTPPPPSHLNAISEWENNNEKSGTEDIETAIWIANYI